MEEIIKKAIEGGYNSPINPEQAYPAGYRFSMEMSMVLDPKFFQALGKACGWEKDGRHPMYFGVHFHEINLKQGWDKAIEYLTNLLPPN